MGLVKLDIFEKSFIEEVVLKGMSRSKLPTGVSNKPSVSYINTDHIILFEQIKHGVVKITLSISVQGANHVYLRLPVEDGSKIRPIDKVAKWVREAN